MSILAAIRREEKKVKKQMAKLQGDLHGLQAAAKALGKSASRELTIAKKRVLSTAGRELTTTKKRVLSAAGRAKISKAAKKRWAKIRAGAKQAIA